MKKESGFLKRFMAALLAVMLLLCAVPGKIGGIEAFAANGVNYLRILDFDSSVSDNISSFKGGFAGAEFARQNQDGAGELHLDAVGGVFGKDESDKAMHLYNNPSVPYTLSDSYAFLNIGDTSSTQMLLTKGSWEKVSFEIAYDGEQGAKQIDAMYNGSWIGSNWQGTYGGKNNTQLFKVMPDGRVAIFNEILQSENFKAMEKQKWYDVDILFYAGSSTAESEAEQNRYTLYINNVEVATRTFVPTTAKNGAMETFPGFAGFWIGEFIFEGQNSTNLYPQKDLYIDNFSMLTTQSDSKPYIYEKRLENNMDYTAETVPASGSLYGGTLDPTRKKTSYVYQTGLGGKSDDEYAFLVKTEDYDGMTVSENGPFIYYYRTGGDAAIGQMNHSAWQDRLNYEVSVLLTDFNVSGARFEFIAKARNGIEFKAATIYPGGDIICNNKVVGKYSQNQWIRLGVSISLTDRKIHTYINGKHVGETSTASGNIIDSFKMNTVFPTATSAQSWNATVAYDDMLAYSGDYIVSSTLNKVKASAKSGCSDRIYVDNEENIISLNGIGTAEAAAEALDVPSGETLTFFTDNTYKTKAATLESGMTAVLTDGKIYRYYTVEKAANEGYILNSFSAKSNGVETDTTFTEGTLAAEASIRLYEPVDISLLIAQYEENKLKKCVYSDNLTYSGEINVFNGTQASISASMQIENSDNQSAKIYLWEKNTMKPICPPIELESAKKGEITSVIERYPGYANKAVTLSFDDGRAEDKELIELYDKYGVRGTFNLNSNLQLLSNESSEQKAYVKELYKNQEVASHVRNHPHLGAAGKPAEVSVSTAEEYIALIDQGISDLQEITGQSIEGMAWPYTNPTLMSNSSAEEASKIDLYVKNNPHIKYSRIADVTGSFSIPETFKDWSFTCHYLSVPSLQEQFLAIPDSSAELNVFSIWGHSYEFANNGNNIYVIENLLKEVTARNIWVPTNLEFVNYINALRGLEKGTNYIKNNSETDVYLLVNYKPVKIAANSTYTLYEDEENSYPAVYLAGDSTCEIPEESLYPRNGWGMWLGSYLSDNIKVNNCAKAARSTKTFISEGRLDSIMSSIKKGDYLFVQFGHNDSMTGTDRATTVSEYKENLKTFISRAREKEAQPVLLTSIRLCIFENGEVKADSVDNYRNAMKEVAAEMNVPLIDVGEIERAYMNEIGESESQKLYMVSGAAEGYTGTTDTTHLCVAGAKKVANLIANEIKNSAELGELGYFVK